MAKKTRKKRKILAIVPQSKEGKFKIPKEKPKYHNEKPRFAFNYYVDQDKNWSFRYISDCKQFHAFFRNLKRMSSLTWGKIKDAHQFYAHEINWNKSTLPSIVKKLEKNPEIQDLSLFQSKAFDEYRIVGLFNYEIIQILKACKEMEYQLLIS